jgi:hypothetical protein
MRFLSFFTLSMFICSSTFAAILSPSKDIDLGYMADVYKTETFAVDNQAARLFAYTGGDPALNGLYLHIAVMNDDYDWNVYFLKNLNDYQRLPSAKEGYIKILLKTDDRVDGMGLITPTTSIMYINLTQAHKVNGKIEVEEIKSK